MFLFHDILYVMFAVWDEEMDTFIHYYLQCVLANRICLGAIVIQPTQSMQMHAHFDPHTTSYRVVGRIQSLCNIVGLSLECYELYTTAVTF